MSGRRDKIHKTCTGLVDDDFYLAHRPEGYHPECPARLQSIKERLLDGGPPDGVVRIAPAPAPVEWITEIHSEGYVRELRESCNQGKRLIHSPDNYICPDSYDVALLAAGGVLEAISAVMDGGAANAFCALRPPGHHALRDEAMGFCLFNNVAVGARFLQKKYGLGKVLIVDWDVHHGNGTQEAFYEDPGVLFFSIHRHPFYPGSGAGREEGRRGGCGYTINVPLPAGRGDADYLHLLESRLLPAAMDFAPEFVLISAGFDAHRDDPLGGMDVTAEGFARMTRMVRGIAQSTCGGRMVSVLEGGYGLEGLAESVSRHLDVLRE